VSRSLARAAAPAASRRKAAAASVDFGPLDDALGYLLRRAQLAVFDSFIKEFEALGLRPATFSTLVLIDCNPGANQSAIGDALGIRRPNFVALVDRLARQGFVQRKRSAFDRRAQILALTEEGRDLLARALTVHDALERRLTEKIGGDGRNALKSAARRLMDS
jgi:DNA-binding MarR family transcriptional regulator